MLTITTTTMNELNKTDIKQIESTAKKEATEHVIKMFQRPGQLEKIEQYKRRLVRKKLSVEALLKSTMQQQLDDVRVGLNKLQTSLDEVTYINNKLKNMFHIFGSVPKLYATLSEVREENMRHSQYVTAKENLKHIFTVPESVEKTKQWINEGKLLHSHQCLKDLENSRDDLLYELHKLPNQSPHDKSMLKAYFADVQVLSTLLEKQLRFILSRTLNTVRKEPTVIVTALRIIEREEKQDELALKQEKQNGFLAPDRPKKWKEIALNILEKSVATRIEGTQVEDRENNKLWLIRYLELIRLMILEDLRVVKSLCVPCFPPRWNIIDTYLDMYHNCLSQHLQEIIENGLEGNEYVTVLSWVKKTYKSPDLLYHPDLVEHSSKLGDLLPPDVMNNLESQYLKNIENNYIDWMQNTLKSEQCEWRSNNDPDDASYNHTSAPIIIFQMIDQNIQVAKTISEDLIFKVLNLSTDQVIRYSESFRTAIIEFKNSYYGNRSTVGYFTKFMIIILNDCLKLMNLGTQLEHEYVSKTSPTSLSNNFNELRGAYVKLRNEAGTYLLHELIVDSQPNFEKIFTNQWLNTTIYVENIYMTIDDYFQDYSKLEPANYRFIADQARLMVAKQYLTLMLSKRVTFKTYEESMKAAEKVIAEADRLRQLFKKLYSESEGEDPFESIIMLSEVLKSDNDMLSFELHRVAEKYPDISDDHLLRLLSLRGDLARSDIRDKVAHIEKPTRVSANVSTIFRTLYFPKTVNINLNF